MLVTKQSNLRFAKSCLTMVLLAKFGKAADMHLNVHQLCSHHLHQQSTTDSFGKLHARSAA